MPSTTESLSQTMTAIAPTAAEARYTALHHHFFVCTNRVISTGRVTHRWLENMFLLPMVVMKFSYTRISASIVLVRNGSSMPSGS